MCVCVCVCVCILMAARPEPWVVVASVEPPPPLAARPEPWVLVASVEPPPPLAARPEPWVLVASLEPPPPFYSTYCNMYRMYMCSLYRLLYSFLLLQPLISLLCEVWLLEALR